MLTRRLASASLLLVIVTGCASSATTGASVPEASVPPTSASPSPTVAPTPAATPFVSSADEAGAKAFVYAYWAEWSRAYATGDTSRLVPYRLASCFCANTVTRVRSVYRAGGSFSGAKLTILKWYFGDHGPVFADTGISVYSAKITVHAPGKKDVVQRDLYAHYFIDLRRVGNHWVISAMRFKEVPAS